MAASAPQSKEQGAEHDDCRSHEGEDVGQLEVVDSRDKGLGDGYQHHWRRYPQPSKRRGRGMAVHLGRSKRRWEYPPLVLRRLSLRLPADSQP